MNRVLNEDNKAWMILTEDEKLALKLNFGLNKSTWEGSEIMGKSHYKYLEIAGRARQLFKLFSEYFETHNNMLIPYNVEVDDDFDRYLESVIIDRMKVREAMRGLKDRKYVMQADRDTMIIKNMQKLQAMNSVAAGDLFNLVKEFDRWNNHRILPIELQEPHAFKRRNKKRIQKYIKNLMGLEEWVITSIIQNYSVPSPKGETLYFALPLENRIELSKIIYIRKDEVAIKRFTEAGLFLFAIPEYAKEFLEVIVDYFSKDERHCTEGQIFWPRVRVILKNAINYNEIERLAPNRRYLEEATKNLDLKKVRNYQQSKLQN